MISRSDEHWENSFGLEISDNPGGTAGRGWSSSPVAVHDVVFLLAKMKFHPRTLPLMLIAVLHSTGKKHSWKAA